MSNITRLSVETALVGCLRTAENQLKKVVEDVHSDINKKLEINECDKTTITFSVKCKLTCDKQSGISATVRPDWPRPKLAAEEDAGQYVDGEELISRCEVCRGEGCDSCKGTGCIDPTREEEGEE